MPRVTYLKKIGNRYYLQRRVPKDLEGEYPPRPIKRPLGTSDYAEAKAKLQVELSASAIIASLFAKRSLIGLGHTG